MNVLVSPLGLSPGVVTGAYYALDLNYTRMDQIITVTTENRQANACENIIELEIENIEDETGHHIDYSSARRYRLNTEEIKTKEDLREYSRIIRELLRHHHESGDQVFLNLTGGHKSMIAAAAMAAQYFAPELTFHLWVDDEIEANGRINTLLLKRTSDRRQYLKPAPGKFILVPLEIEQVISPRELRREKDKLLARLFEVEISYYLEDQLGFRCLPSGRHLDFLQGYEVDFYAEKYAVEKVKVITGDAKLGTITTKGVTQAIKRRDAVCDHFKQRNTDFDVESWVVTTHEGEIDDFAIEKAKENQIRLFKAKLPLNWRDRADWKVADLETVV